MAAAPVRRAVPAAQPVAGLNFGDLSFYTTGGGLPDGKYAMYFDVRMYQYKKADGTPVGQPALGVMATAYPLDDPSEANKREQFYGMGRKSHLSFAPNPDTGKGIVPLAGGAGGSINHMCNWGVFIKSLYDCGLPQGIFTNDLSVLDGIHVHVQQVDEPAERKSFKAAGATGEASEEQGQGNGKIAIVTEIMDDGKPWEGTGGIPDVAPAAAPAPRVAPRPAAAPAAKSGGFKPAAPGVRFPAPAPVAAPAPAEEAAPLDEDLELLTINAVTDVLTLPKNANGCSKLVVKGGVFAAIKASHGEETAISVGSTYFADDASLNSILGPLGYTVSGAQVKPL